MAALPFTTTRRTLLGAAVSWPIAALPTPVIARTPARGPRQPETTEGQSSPARALWNRRLAEYRRLLAAKEAEEAAGAFRAASDLYDRDYAAIEARFGSWGAARDTEQGRALCHAAFAPMNAAEEAFYDDFTAPLQRAAVCLALTPAPDLEAVLERIRVMDEQELNELGSMTRPVLEVLADDVVQLTTTGY
jgi:hypothetical protein